MANQGLTLLRNPIDSKGTGFALEERQTFGLTGLLPSRVENVDEQVQRFMVQLAERSTSYEKYLYLRTIKLFNTRAFYRMLVLHIRELAPLVYTPTVGDACLRYSHDFVAPEGLYINKYHRGSIRQVLDSWPEPDVKIIVVSDGSRILGLGDLGVNGMGIPVGKLSLYISCAGFEPSSTLPVILDVGTNTEKFLQDPFYLGVREPRISAQEYTPFVDEFMQAAKAKWPNVLVQFEDFATPYCFDFLERYRHDYLSFNDDIQGTGSVILSGFMNAVKQVGKPLKDHRLIFFGAGSAATGVADEIVKFFAKQEGVTEAEARKHFYLVDSKGLVTANRGDELAPHKVPYARQDNGSVQLQDLKQTIDYVKPTGLFGLAVQPGAFTKEVIEAMSAHNEFPIIFPLSNPTSKSECTFQQALDWSDGKVIFASGSPFQPIERDGRLRIPGQGNNMYIFPGLGLGAVLAKATKVTDSMVYTASHTLANCVTREQLAAGLLYPPLTEIRSISARIAAAVVRKSIEEGISRETKLHGLSDQQLLHHIESCMFNGKDWKKKRVKI